MTNVRIVPPTEIHVCPPFTSQEMDGRVSYLMTTGRQHAVIQMNGDGTVQGWSVHRTARAAIAKALTLPVEGDVVIHFTNVWRAEHVNI